MSEGERTGVQGKREARQTRVGNSRRISASPRLSGVVSCSPLGPPVPCPRRA